MLSSVIGSENGALKFVLCHYGVHTLVKESDK